MHATMAVSLENYWMEEVLETDLLADTCANNYCYLNIDNGCNDMPFDIQILLLFNKLINNQSIDRLAYNISDVSIFTASQIIV